MFALLVVAACISGHLGLDITNDALTLRLARSPASNSMGTWFSRQYTSDDADNDNDGDAEADPIENDEPPPLPRRAPLARPPLSLPNVASHTHHDHDDHQNDHHHHQRHEDDDVGKHRSTATSPSRHPAHVDDAPRAHDTHGKMEPASSTRAKGSKQASEIGAQESAIFESPRRLSREHPIDLETPGECNVWRSVSQDTTRLQLYRRHFTSLDFTDWFIFVSMFTEAWHRRRRSVIRRPVYVDIAANHARRWSNTYFLDRCMGWDGICAEANAAYHAELRSERHCALIATCISDRPRAVNFSFTAAYGGVVRGAADRGAWGVDGGQHATRKKYAQHFRGFKTLTCTTLARELGRLKVAHVDFLSLDVEGYELPVLMGIDWSRVVIDVLVVENKRPEIVSFLTNRGFNRYRAVLKDDIYIRKASGYSVDPKFASWLTDLSKADYKIYLPSHRSH